MSELHGIARFTFPDGRVDEFKRLSAKCMEIVRTKDSGTLQYDIYFNDDETACVVHERYKDSDALIEHGVNIGDELMQAVAATGAVTGLLLGEPSEKLRANMGDGDGPVQLFTPYESM